MAHYEQKSIRHIQLCYQYKILLKWHIMNRETKS